MTGPRGPRPPGPAPRRAGPAGRRGPAAAALALAGTALAAGCALLGGGERDALVAEGRRLFAEQRCQDCHQMGAAGTPIGPDLAGAGRRHGEADLARWLRDPAAQEPTRHMPPLALTDGQARALAAYLTAPRRGAPAP